jgi:hypothetical protein
MATMKEFMEYEGTETEPFILDEPIDIFSNEIDYKTPFGVRWGGETITLKAEHLDALIQGKHIAIDIQHEYIAFLKLEIEKDSKDGFCDINSEYHHQRMRELVDEMFVSKDLGNLSLAIDQMADTLIVVNRERIRLKRSQRHHIAKAEKWEERARALYRELHGKDAPPQG